MCRFEAARERWLEAVRQHRFPPNVANLFTLFVQGYAGAYIHITPNFETTQSGKSKASAKFIPAQFSAPANCRMLYIS